MSEIKTDILIIGGGIAGCIAAISLADEYKVILIDKLLEPAERIGESLAPAAQRILRALNLSDDLMKGEGSLFKVNHGMQSYWGSDIVYIVDHMRNPDGFVKSLDRKAFERYLRSSAERCGVQCMWGTKLFKAKYDECWHVKLTHASKENTHFTVRATYVIDASGRQSQFARGMGIHREVLDKLIACWMTIPNSKDNTMSTISSSENGWWYSAVVPNNKRVVAFHTDSDLIAKSVLKSGEGLMNLVKNNKEISDLIDVGLEEIEFQGVVSANSTKLSQVAGPFWAAIGDAAISFDPLSSQGMFNAMASAMQLKDLIKEHSFALGVASKYTQQIDQIWHHYLGHRKTFYQAEQRWRNSEFWQRRHDF